MTEPDEPQDDRTEALQQGIDDARRQAQEHGTLPNPDPEPTLVDPDGDGVPD